jgi:diguanylate cyclase (GGDEF)-like protein/PAS domain S-box-containing protein
LNSSTRRTSHGARLAPLLLLVPMLVVAVVSIAGLAASNGASVALQNAERHGLQLLTVSGHAHDAALSGTAYLVGHAPEDRAALATAGREVDAELPTLAHSPDLNPRETAALIAALGVWRTSDDVRSTVIASALDGSFVGSSRAAIEVRFNGALGAVAAQLHAANDVSAADVSVRQEQRDATQLVSAIAIAIAIGIAFLGAAWLLRLLSDGREAVRRRERRLSSLVENASDGILVIAANRQIAFVTPSFAEDFLGTAPQTVDFDALIHPDDRGQTWKVWDRVITGGSGAVSEVEARLRRVDGEWRYVVAKLTNRVDDAAVAGVVLNVTDASDRREFEKQLTYQAFHDSLTGLPNRALFLDRLEQAHRRSMRSSTRYAVLMLDLDDFKTINDTAGHGAGDELLQEVSRRLADGMRPADTGARLGGDEFGILLEDLKDDTEALAVADRLLASLRRPVAIAEGSRAICATIGVAVSDQLHIMPAEIVRNADIALYAGKALGKNRHQLFNEQMHATVLDRMTLANELRDGIGRGEFFLLYQPKVDSTSGLMVGVEALVRWNHPLRGLMTPDAFIPLAEEIGLIVELDAWVLETACRQASSWGRPTTHPLSLAVNISGRDVDGSGLLERVRRVLAETGLEPYRLELELTETVAVAQRAEVLRDIRALGVRIAIDDFGTGYSMLSRLQDFPIDTLKIDRSFVNPITSLDSHSPIVAATVAMARGLDLGVVAEGVETEEQRLFLLRQGCGQLQGYLISRPVEPERIPPMLGIPLLVPAEDPRWTALDTALGVASAKPAAAKLVCGLLRELQRLTGFDSVYLTRIHWARREQRIEFSCNCGPVAAPEGLLLPWPNTLSRTSLTATRTDAGTTKDVALAIERPQSDDMATLDQTFISVPVLLHDGSMFGTLCGASGRRVDLPQTGLQVMRIFASIIGAQAPSLAGPTRYLSVHPSAHRQKMSGPVQVASR